MLLYIVSFCFAGTEIRLLELMILYIFGGDVEVAIPCPL